MLFSKDYNDEITEEMIDTYKKFKKLASTDPEEAIELLEDEFDINFRRAKQIVNRLQKPEDDADDLETCIAIFKNMTLLEDDDFETLADALRDKTVKVGEIRESMDELCEALEDEILGCDLSDEIKKKMLGKLRKFTTTETNIMLVGATGAGKSSTINALFSVGNTADDEYADEDDDISNEDEESTDEDEPIDEDYHYVEVAKVGTKSDPETKIIEKYSIGNLILWDTPGLGDSTEEDESHIDVISDLLDETDDDGNALIDLVLVILDGSTRDLGTSYRIINDIILPKLEGDTSRILVALNQADIAMKTGRHWDYEKNEPDDTLIAFLEDKVRSIHDRILEDSGVEVDPIYYCAGYMEEETGEVIRPYNLSKLLLYIMNSIPPMKRAAVMAGINTDSENYEFNDDDEDYNEGVKDAFFSSFGSIMEESVEKGAEIGLGVLGVPGAIVGGVVGAAVGVVRGLFNKIFG